MAHPMYRRCLSHVNKPITVHHVDGSRYFGTLQRVTPDGLYLASTTGMRTVTSSKEPSVTPQTIELEMGQGADVQEVFFAPFFFPFAALAGFTIGYVAGARRAYYPPYPYPYAYPYHRYYW